MHTLCILCINFMHTMCILCETCDLGGPYPPKSLLHLTNSQGAACLSQRVKSQCAWFGARGTPSATAGFGAGGARYCTWPPQPPKRRVDQAVLEDRQRCSPLTKTYGKSAGMVWGRWDHFCDIQVLVVHVRLAPAATSGARFGGELVGARKNRMALKL